MMTLDRLPKWLFCIPFVVQWMWLAILYRSLTLPSVINPRIENGGLAGESKIAYLNQVDQKFHKWVAQTVAVKSSDQAERVHADLGLIFPLVAKPDIGWCGYGVRRINDAKELSQYAESFPKDAIFLIQPFIYEPFEAALFYERHPSEPKGSLTSITIRHRPFVLGDGLTVLSDLIKRNTNHGEPPRPHFSEVDLIRIPSVGEVVYLTTVASLRVGGRYEDATRMMTTELTDAVSDICISMGKFH